MNDYLELQDFYKQMRMYDEALVRREGSTFDNINDAEKEELYNKIWAVRELMSFFANLYLDVEPDLFDGGAIVVRRSETGNKKYALYYGGRHDDESWIHATVPKECYKEMLDYLLPLFFSEEETNEYFGSDPSKKRECTIYINGQHYDKDTCQIVDILEKEFIELFLKAKAYGIKLDNLLSYEELKFDYDERDEELNNGRPRK